MNMMTHIKTVLVLLCWFPLNAAGVNITFESTCNNDAPFVSGATGNCALFGLSEGDTVSGSITYDDSLFTPGSGISLEIDQYDFSFQFGNQSFNEADNTLTLVFIVAHDGSAISSMAGVFQNASGARLSLLTSSTVLLRLGNQGADTFAEGSRWHVSGPSEIPVPASAWLFTTAILLARMRLFS